jgi:hypothetical protein
MPDGRGGLVRELSLAGQWVSGKNPGIRWEVSSDAGWLTVERFEVLFGPNFGSRTLWSLESRSEPGARNSSGFFIDRHHGIIRARPPGEQRPPPPSILGQRIATPWYYRLRIGVSYAMVCGVSAVLPALWLWRALARRRRRRIGPGFEPITRSG